MHFFGNSSRDVDVLGRPCTEENEPWGDHRSYSCNLQTVLLAKTFGIEEFSKNSDSSDIFSVVESSIASLS